jgi:uncharacterized protein YutE (UPF0331/DUF86 family)
LERIRRKISRIREHLALVRSIQGDCRKRFITDPIYRGALLHYLYLIADGCIVLAELVIKENRIRLPQSYAEAFDILAENQLLTAEFAHRFAGIAGFRNFLAHDYEKVEGEVVCGQILDKLAEVDEFLQQIETTLDAKST